MREYLKKMLIVLVIILSIITISGCSNEAKIPIEKEVSDALKWYYTSCLTEEEIENISTLLYKKYPLATYWRWPFASSCSLDCEKQNPLLEKEIKELISSKYHCDKYIRKMNNDYFVSFKKTDGQLINPWEYKMLGKLSMFNSVTGKEEEHEQEIKFELMESGWNSKRYWINIQR